MITIINEIIQSIIRWIKRHVAKCLFFLHYEIISSQIQVFLFRFYVMNNILHVIKLLLLQYSNFVTIITFLNQHKLKTVYK